MDGKIEALRLVSNLLSILNPKATRELQNKPIFPIIKDPYVPVKLPQGRYPNPLISSMALTCMGVLSADKAVKPTMSLK